MRVVAALVLLLAGTAGVGSAAVSPWAGLAEPVFLHVDTRELPEGVANALAQDDSGLLWVGTQGGLARYDGYHFKSYIPDPTDPKALPDGYIRSMLAAAGGGLWIGTDSNGLVRYDDASDSFRTWRADPRGRRGPRSATIYAMAATSGGLWIGGDAGLDYFDTKAGAFAPVPFDNGKTRAPPVRSILIDRNGTLWLATDEGVYRRDAGQSRFTRFALAASANGPLRVMHLYEDREGNIWAGCVDAVYELDRERRVRAAFHAIPHDARTIVPGPQLSIIEPTAGTIWTGSSDGGISIVDAAAKRVRRIMPSPTDTFGLTPGRLVQFLRDRSGLIWLANHSGGLLQHNPLGRGAYVLTRGRFHMGDTGATGLAVRDGQLWIGGAHGTLVGIDPNGREMRLEVPTRSTIAGLNFGLDGKLWVGTIGGLCALASDRSSVDCPSGPKQIEHQTTVWLVVETADARWIGTGRGLFEEDKRSGAVTVYRHGNGPDGITSDLIGAVYPDRNGKYVWVGTANGFNRIDPQTHRVTRYTFDPRDATSFGPGSVETILQDRTGRIWVGMNGGPLNLMEDPEGKARFVHLDTRNGLPHENVDGLAQDAGGHIWASTDSGIALIDPATLRARPFGQADGVLPSDYWGGSVAQASDGTMFFGADDGVSIVAPNAASPWTYAPPVVLTSVKVADKAVPLAAAVTLPPNDRDVTAEFAALDYSDPQALQYQYRLEGFENDWVPTDTLHRIVTYTNLPPGHYVLRVRATNRLGVWSPYELAVNVDAAPAWYETWWFRALIAIAAVLAIAGLLQLRTASLRRQTQELEATVRERTRALEEASLTDPLTGLRNRRFVMQMVGQDASIAMRRYDTWLKGESARPEDADVIFFMIDIDHFKRVNDEFGHHAGDSVLVQMRERLQHVFRETDYLVRWGGEEFLAIARGSSRADAPEIAERVRTEVANRPFDLGDGRTIDKTVSIGFAAFPYSESAPHDVEWQRAIDLADRALYEAKESGRNAWRGAHRQAQGDTYSPGARYLT